MFLGPQEKGKFFLRKFFLHTPLTLEKLLAPLTFLIRSMSFAGGKLKLKGGSDLPGIKKKKKSKDSHSSAEIALAVKEGGEGFSDKASEGSDDVKRALHGFSLSAQDDSDDRRTPAEKKYDEHMKKLEGSRLQKMAAKSHRYAKCFDEIVWHTVRL